MIRITVVSHIVIDTVISYLHKTTSLGGPPIYAGLTAKNMGGNISFLTKYGKDIPEKYLLWLIQNQIKIPDDSCSLEYPTTRFQIIQNKKSRKLKLLAKCENIENIRDDLNGDAFIVSPVAGEIDINILDKLKELYKTIYLDPQGFIRRFNPDGSCFFEKIDQKILNNIDILKMDEQEAYYITGSKDPIKALQKTFDSEIKVSIFTRGSKGILLLCSKGLFEIPVIKKIKIVDLTGIGDIFAGAFTFTYLQDNDPVWAATMATAAASMGINKIGILKIPKSNLIEGAEEIFENIKKIKI